MLDAQNTPQPILLADYAPPAFTASTVHLDFQLDPAETTVISRVKYTRAGKHALPLVLHGEHQALKWIKLDGQTPKYQLDDETLTVETEASEFTLEICSTNAPAKNTSLTGLYVSGGNFCTQCEAEGFRRITYFLDRPDVMAAYTVRMEAEAKDYPVLLSNGNPIESGQAENGRHWALWEDPFPKPSYLFALVAGDLKAVTDSYRTASGRDVTLNIYVRQADLDKCDHAMESLKNSMRWDEEVFGLEYDLDLYNIVAVSDFNMGAMENKGLNVFNTRYVLANAETATDTDFDHVEGVIAHEYFHNWTGNRVTCRDWFQLSLKEGLTVFRDQEFSSDMGSRALKRIDDVRVLRAGQFPEDAGPMAHPVRPESYMEINNFYTATIYNKGAEVIRLMYNLVGKDGFRKGMDLYFQRHDGQAVTCDDFAAAIADANGADLSQFKLWYSQAGTPQVKAGWSYDADAQALDVTFSQAVPPTPGQADKAPMVIPIRTGLLGQNGAPLEFAVEGGASAEEHVLQLTQTQQTFRLTGVAQVPVPSLLRGFSAPVKLNTQHSAADKAFLAAHDADSFNRWEAMQSLVTDVVLAQAGAAEAQDGLSASTVVDVARNILEDATLDPAFKAEMLILPSDNTLLEHVDLPDPLAISAARKSLRDILSDALREQWTQTYHASSGGDSRSPEARAARRLKNIALSYRMADQNPEAVADCFLQFNDAKNMTDALAALGSLAHGDSVERQEALASFHTRWHHDALVLDKWFSIQAGAQRADVLNEVVELMQHKDFSIRNPNRFRALVGVFTHGNVAGFHGQDGAGYKLLADQVIEVDAINPQLAARMLSPLGRWRRLAAPYSGLMKAELERIAGHEGLSKDSSEIALKSLA